MKLKLNGIDHIHVYVSDRQKALQWYQNVLGFESSRGLTVWDENSNGPFMMKDSSGVHLALFKRDQVTPSSAIAFNADAESFIAWKQFLEEKNLSLRVADHKSSWSLYFKDADANMYEISTGEYDAVAGVLNSSMLIREMQKSDIGEVYRLRMITRENALSKERLESLGITEPSVAKMMDEHHKGWVCEEGKQIAGFAMGDAKLGELWVIAIHPDHEGKGIGKQLILKVQSWLWESGWQEIWLTTDVDESLRAYGFYKSLGWEDKEIKDGLRYMVLKKS